MPIRLKSGREINPYDRIVGLSIDGEVSLREGYDDSLHTSDLKKLTQDELVEVADLMIGRWTAARAGFAAGEVPTDYVDVWAQDFV